jgi:hypothetical protein
VQAANACFADSTSRSAHIPLAEQVDRKVTPIPVTKRLHSPRPPVTGSGRTPRNDSESSVDDSAS